MLLYYIRHGQSANNALFDATGTDTDRVLDPELTLIGIQQAARVAEALRCGQPLHHSNAEELGGFGVTHVYSSLMVRALLTGQAIARALNLPLLGWTELHEGGGIWLADRETNTPVGYPGNSRVALCERFPELVWPADAREDGWWNRPFEEREERPLRARRVLDELLRRHGGSEDRVVFVSHGGFFYWLMRAVLGLPPHEDAWFHMYNTGITCLEFDGDGSVGVRYLNRVDHLPYDLIT